MTGDLFNRALENAGSVTAEELKLNSIGENELVSEVLPVESTTTKNEAVSEVLPVDSATTEVVSEENSLKENSPEQIKSGEEIEQSEDNINNNNTSNSKKDNGSSSEYDSSSSDSSDSEGDADDDSDAGQIDEIAEDDDDEPNSNEPIKSKNEILDDKIIEVPENYKIDEKTNIAEIGIIKSVFESNVIVEGITSGEKRVLKDGSIFCLENREVVGTLSEVFGQLQRPFYRVGISPVNESKNEITAKVKNLIGTKIFIVVPDAHWIDTFELKRIRGTDASNGYDEELPEDEQEFSDDEKEAQYKKMLKNQKKRKNNSNSKSKDNNKVNKKKPQNNNNNTSNNYAKMKLPIGMTQQNPYKSRNNRTAEDNINNSKPQNPQPTNYTQNKYQPPQGQYNAPQPQGQYNNYNNNVTSYPPPNMQNNTIYPPPPQFNNNFAAPGQAPFAYNSQPNGFNSGYNNMQYNYPNQAYQQYPPQPSFQQPPAYNQNQNMYYQQPNAVQYQQSLPPQQPLAQVHQLHQILLQQRNNDNNQTPSPSTQNTGSQDKPNNTNTDIQY